MKLILFLVLFCFIYTENSDNEFNKKYSYGYLSSEFLKTLSENIFVSRSKTNLTKCFAIKDIKINDTILVYDKKDIISNINIIHPNIKKITSIIKKYINDIYLQNKFLLSFFIFHVMTNPYNIPDINNKLRLFILYLPIEEINPIELFLDEKSIELNLIKKEWLDYEKSDEIDLINKMMNLCLNIDINDKTDKNYILFGKIYYFVTTNSFNVNGNAIILPFFDSCNIAPNYLHKGNLNCDSIYIKEGENKIMVKSKLDFSQSNQFIFSFNNDLTNDYLLLKKGKVVFNNLNDVYIINKTFSFENNSELSKFLLKMNLKKDDLEKLKLQRQGNIKYIFLNFKLFPNKIDGFLDKFSKAYFNNNLIKKYIFIIRICFEELNDLLKIIKQKFESKNFEEYLLRAQDEKEISQTKNALMNFNLAKIRILRKNVELSFENLIKLYINDINSFKMNYTDYN